MPRRNKTPLIRAIALRVVLLLVQAAMTLSRGRPFTHGLFARPRIVANCCAVHEKVYCSTSHAVFLASSKTLVDPGSETPKSNAETSALFATRKGELERLYA